MPYTVNFTDSANKDPITVFDNTSDTISTSLKLPGRNVTGYGQIIAENFLHLLENFAGDNKPQNAVEGQLWYDKTTRNLQINVDGTAEGWKPASGIQRGPSESALRDPSAGELWVDTTNQQLRIYTGTRWLLVGPSESSIDGLRYGPVTETIADTNNINRSILLFYIADVPVAIFSKDSFTPKVSITGFTTIRSGINLNLPSSGDLSNFVGGLKPKLYGIASSADALNIGDTEISAAKFLRSDTANITNFGISVRNNTGITIGPDDSFELSNTSAAARIYNKSPGSSIDLQINRNDVATTVLKVIENRVGINQQAPSQALDVVGNTLVSGTLSIGSQSEALNNTSASITTKGGIWIDKNLSVGTFLSVLGDSRMSRVLPRQRDAYDLGDQTTRWNNIYTKKIFAEEFQGTLVGNINGNADTATSLQTITTFKMQGDVVSNTIQFDGQIGTSQKVFQTEFTAGIIKGKQEQLGRSNPTDFVLIYRASEESGTASGLFKMPRDRFVSDLGIPIGTILPYAGNTAPDGFLFCDGSELQKVQYPELFDIIGVTYNGAIPLVGFNTFRLPDLRGRFALGKDNMFNGLTVPNVIGGNPSAGGGETLPRRVPGNSAISMGGTGGSSQYGMQLENIPEHTHTLSNAGRQYNAVRLDTSVNLPATPGPGPTTPGAAQYFSEAGPVKKPNEATQLGQPIPLMNPYLTINYIIRTGPPAFVTTTTN